MRKLPFLLFCMGTLDCYFEVYDSRKKAYGTLDSADESSERYDRQDQSLEPAKMGVGLEQSTANSAPFLFVELELSISPFLYVDAASRQTCLQSWELRR
jgi:hypothetical protein